MIARAAVVAWKELRELRRDRPTLAMMTALPVMQLLLFGYAINTDVRHTPMVVYDQDHTAASRDLVRRLEATTFFDVVGQVRDYREIGDALRTDRARVALVVPSRFSSDLARGTPVEVQLVVDGSDPQTVESATNTAMALGAASSLDLVVHRFAREGIAGAPLEVVPTTWYNPDLRTAVFIVPGLVGLILTMTMVMLTSMAIVRERERGTFEQLIVSPVKNRELVAGKIAPYVLVGYLQLTLVLVAGRLIFGVPFVGSALLLYALTFVFIVANLAVGLFVSTVTRTQQQAMQLSFFLFLPSVLLSGFMFPFEAMPALARAIGNLMPLTHYLRIVRGIALKGAGFTDVAGELGWLALILVGLVVATSLRFRKRID
ncbi:MAG: ABC transporter permease [Kofleriaceae bacterium]